MNTEIMEQDIFRLITLLKPSSVLSSDVLEVNATVVRFQREEKMMEGFEINSFKLHYITLRQFLKQNEPISKLEE